VIPALYWLLERLRHVHVDWIGVGILFALSMIFTVVVSKSGSLVPRSREGVTPRGQSAQKVVNLLPLQVECIALARELKWFLNTMPPPDTNAIQIMRQSRDVFDWSERLTQRTEQRQAWSQKLGHAYADQFSDRVTDLVHKLGAEGVDVSLLMVHSKWVSNEDDVNAAISVLRKLAFEVEDNNEARISRRSEGARGFR
jgi:hypothetical protein